MTTPAFVELPTAERARDWMRQQADDGLAQARRLVEELLADTGTDTGTATATGTAGSDRTTLDVLRAWDRVDLVLGNVGAVASLFSSAHPDPEVRAAAEAADAEVDRIHTELHQDRRLHDLLAGLDATGLDEQAARFLAHTLRDFERAGVDRDDDTRARLLEVSERITAVGQEFARAIREDVRTVRVPADRLAGMPEDWLEAHPADADGLVAVTTDYPDSVPARMFVHDADVRREVTAAFLDRGWPGNEPLLRELFDLRQEYAGLLGFDDWAAFDAAVKMIGDGPAIPAFVDRIAEAAEGPMRRDREVLLERVRRDRPDATGVDAADASYYEELLRREQHDVDAQQVRRYFAFDKVRRGLLDVTGRLFGLRYEPAADAVVWHEDVTAYDVYADAVREGDGEAGAANGAAELLGRIYLDLHPREGKYKHAAQFTIARGVAGRQLPEGALLCNFSRGLMEHSHVVTLFHEFGHLIHHLVGGHVAWTRFSGVATEWDFVEAPSQMLEEWARDATVLAGFATDDAGRSIPAELVERMRAADEVGTGLQVRQQMFYAAVSYWFHVERPSDLTAAMVALQERYSPYDYIRDTHFFAAFGHLGGYSSGYYTYQWSLVIAKDLFSAFDPADLLAPDVARRYRDTVLAAGGTRDAADLVADFLGRPFSFDAYAAWLAR